MIATIVIIVLAIILITSIVLIQTKPTEKYCDNTKTGIKMSLSEAKTIAENSECTGHLAKDGEPFCNQDIGWEFVLKVESSFPGGSECGGVCRIYLNKTAKVARMCFGDIPPCYQQIQSP